MTVGELIERLQQFDSEKEVRILMQRSWPLVSEIDEIWEGEGESREGENEEDIVYVQEGYQIGYGPSFNDGDDW